MTCFTIYSFVNMSRGSRSEAVRKALVQAKLETGGTVKASTPSSDYKERIDRLMSKTKDLKIQKDIITDDTVEDVAVVSPLSDENVSTSQHTIETVSEEDEYIRISVSNDEKKASKDVDVNNSASHDRTTIDTDDIILETQNEAKSEVVVDMKKINDGTDDDVAMDNTPMKTSHQALQSSSSGELVEPSTVSVSRESGNNLLPKKEVGMLSPMSKFDPVPEGAEFRKSHAVFTVSKDLDMTELYNVWVPFNCSWEELTESIQNKVKINSSRSILKIVLTEYTGDILSPDIETSTKFFKIFQNYEAGNSTFVLTIDQELEAKLQAEKDLAAFRAAALRLTFRNDKTQEENYAYLNRSFDWQEVLNAIVLDFPGISPNWISHIVIQDADGDEISPPISNLDKFWKFTRTASMHNGDIFIFYLDEEKIAEDARKEAEKEFLESCRPITCQVVSPNTGAEFSALVPLNGDWEAIRKQISNANTDNIADPSWIVEMLLVDAESDNLSPTIDGDAMFWKVYPTYSSELEMKYLIYLDGNLIEEHARVKALEEFRASAKHLRITLANDQNSDVGDIYVPHQCEWDLLTEGVADYLNISTGSWIDYFVLLDHEHDPISPPLKNITMFWKACEKFSIEKGMVLNVYLKPEAIKTLKELAFLSKANSFRVRLAPDGDSDDALPEVLESNRVYVNPDSNWKEMATAIALTLNLDSYEWIENVVLIDEEGDVLSPSIKTTEKFWRFYKKSLDKSIFLVNQDEALKAGALANKRQLDEEARKEKEERERLERAGMKVFHCSVYDHEVSDGSVPPLECDIRVHNNCSWDEILQSIENTRVTESSFVKYLLLADANKQKISVPIKDSKMFWKFAPSAEKRSNNDNDIPNHFEVHLDYAHRAEVLKNREEERIRNLQKKVEVATAVGDKSSTVLLFSDASWDDVRNALIRTCSISEQYEGTCINHVVLYDVDGDQLSPSLDTAEAFWSTFHTVYQYERNMQFVIYLDKEECDRVVAQKAHVEFLRTAFKFKLCNKKNLSSMKDVLVAPKALWQDVVSAIAAVFKLDSPTWVHHIVLLDGDGDPLSKNINDSTLFWKVAASYHYDESKYFELHIDSGAVEETKRQQAHEAFMKAAEHISIRNSSSSDKSNTALLHVIYDSSWKTICKSIRNSLNIPEKATVKRLTLIDEDLDELSPSVCTAEKFWKIYKNNYKPDMNMSFSVEVDESDEGCGGDEKVTGVIMEEVVDESSKILSRKEKLDQDNERYQEELALTKQLAPGSLPETFTQGSEHRPIDFPVVELGYENHGAGIVRSKVEEEELEAAYLKACLNKNLDKVVDLVEYESVNPLARNENNSTAAHFACASSDNQCPVELIMKLYQYGVDLNSINVSGARPISCAVLASDVEACRCLVHYCPEIDLNLVDSTQPLLHSAVMNSDIDMLMWLHEMNVDANVVTPSGTSAVMVALEVTPFDMNVLQYLVVEMGADINYPAPGNYSCLHVAASVGNIPATEFLYEMGMPIDCKTTDGKTPLMFACSQGHLELAKLLHSLGASLYSCGGKVDKLNTSLHLAAQFGHLSIVQWLVEDCRLDPSPRNSRNAAPVDFARAANKMDVFAWLTEWIETHPNGGDSSEFKEYESLEETLFKNDFEQAMNLLEEMSDRFTKDTVLPHGTTPLHYAAAAGYLELAKYLVKEGCDVNRRTSAGRTPLHYACFKGHTDMCMYLYECGASVHEIDNGGLTCLKIAVQNNYHSLVLWLRSVALNSGEESVSNVKFKGAQLPRMTSPSKEAKSTFSSLFSCMSSPPETISHDLGESGTELKETDQNNVTQSGDNEGSGDGDQDSTVFKLAVQLHEACILGDLALAKELIERDKAPVNGSPSFPNPLLPVDEQELTPLHCAVSSGSLPLVQYLVNKGAQVNAQNVGGLFNQAANENSEAMTPLHIACDKQHESIVMYLVGQKADLYKKNMAGDTSLHIICLLGLHTLLKQIVDLPRSTLPDLNLDARSSHLLNLLHCAADAGSVETAKILIDNHVGVNSFDDEKKTPIHYACAKGALSVVKLLVDNGAILDLSDTSGRTPFLFACSSDNLELAKYLSERGAQLDHESAKGNTALHIACKFGRLELVKWLVANGLKADQVNSTGHTPLNYAQANGFSDVVEWLESN